eukprot:2109764-Karenia_brevis.AAC.1
MQAWMTRACYCESFASKPTCWEQGHDVEVTWHDGMDSDACAATVERLDALEGYVDKLASSLSDSVEAAVKHHIGNYSKEFMTSDGVKSRLESFSAEVTVGQLAHTQQTTEMITTQLQTLFDAQQ